MTDTKIIIYGAEWCGPCHMTKRYLNDKSIKYDYVNVDMNPEGGKEAVSKSGQLAIPVIDIGGDIIIGFDRPRLDAALKAHQLV